LAAVLQPEFRLGIDSAGLTAALAVARRVKSMVKEVM
jgi:hypothetical protein